MKELTIGLKTYHLMEDVYDINDKRFNYFKMYLLKSLEGIDRPLFTETHQKATDLMNAHKYLQANGLYENYLKSIEQDGYNDDALSRCFALICLTDSEDQLNTDENYLNEKLADMWANGLTRGLVEESVQNFTIASPQSFGAYALMITEMTQKLDGTFYSALNDLQKNSSQATH